MTKSSTVATRGRPAERWWEAGCLLLCLSLLGGCSSDDDEQDGPDEVDLLGEPDVVGRWPATMPAGFILHDLGVVTSEGGFTEPVEFAADDQTQAVHVIGISHPGTFVLLTEAIAPDGSFWVSPEPAEAVSPAADRYFSGFPGPALSPNRVVARPRAAAALLPNTPALAMQPGAWSFRLGAYAVRYDEAAERYDNEPLTAAMRVGVLERRVEPPPQGHIDLTLTFAAGGNSGSGTIDAFTAPDDPVLQEALAFIDDSLGTVGVRLGEVTYQQAPSVDTRVDLGGPACLGGPSVERAFDAAPEPRPGSLQVLFVDMFACEIAEGVDIGPLFAGIANGVPGRPLAPRDGLVVSTRAMTAAPDLWDKVLAHEMGHFLGVFHTCESDDLACDNIADTLEGPEAAANIMYPDLSQVTDFSFTAQQGEVLRLSPLVQAD